MTKPDLIVVWPDTIDFPLFREWVHSERERFAKVIIVFAQTNWAMPILTKFIQESMRHDDISFVMNDPVENRDWRDVATKKGLSISDSEWVFFTEPDFFPNKNLWEELSSLSDTLPDVIGVRQDFRLHPCCLFIKRSVLDKTSKDFSANPPAHDHFGQIQKDLMNWEPPLVGYTINPKFYYHMNGLSHNMYLLQSGMEPVYKPEEFKAYLEKCLACDINLDEKFVELAKEYVKC